MDYPDYTVDELCGLFGYSKQAYYKRINYECKERIKEDVILQMVKGIREDCPGVGTRKIQLMLEERHGLSVGRDYLFELLRREFMLLRRKYWRPTTTFSYHGWRTYPNLIKSLEIVRPNQVWASDITYVRVGDHFWYLFLITDLYSRKIVGWELAKDMEGKHAITALKNALKQRHGHDNLIHHSDRGSQYCYCKYVEILNKNSIEISMTENGDPRDNAIAERVNGIIKGEYLDYWQLTDKNVTEYVCKAIDSYNNIRPHSSISLFTLEKVHSESLQIEETWKYYPTFSEKWKENRKFAVATNQDDAAIIR